MNNILNAQEAFAALQKGQTVLCRYAGDAVLHADKDFSTLDQMPATVFGLPNYEFCIQLEMLEMAGIKFTKPLTLDELVDDTDVFVINPNGFIHQYTYTGIGDGLVTMVEGGFAQRDFDNAKLQYEALCKLLGGTPIKANLIVAEKKKRTSSKRPTKKEIKAHKDVIIDAISTCINADEVESVCSGLDQHGFNDDQLQVITSAKTEKLESLAAESIESIKDQLATDTPHTDELGPDLSVLYDAFKTAIETAGNESTLDAVRLRINANRDLSEIEHAELTTRLNLKAAFFEKTPPMLRPAVEESNYVNDGGHYFDQVKKETAEWNTQLQELLARLAETKTPEEANALVRYTKSWTEEQRQPLLRAISRRLQEFQNPQAKAEPSLMVKIQTAPDLTTLDALEIDVGSLDPVIQSDMMRIVKTRRLQLENAANYEGQAI